MSPREEASGLLNATIEKVDSQPMHIWRHWMPHELEAPNLTPSVMTRPQRRPNLNALLFEYKTSGRDAK